MTTYYRLTDAALVNLSAEDYAELGQHKRDVLRLYVIDPQPVPPATQTVSDGPVLISDTEARKTWILVAKTAAQLAFDQFVAKRDIDFAQVRTVYLALKNGTGTVAERAARMEKVLCRLIIDALGHEPT